MAKKSQQAKLQSILDRVTRKYSPDDILYELSVLYEANSAAGDTEAEVDYWLKCSRATRNLSSGMEKWLAEAIEEEKEEIKEE